MQHVSTRRQVGELLVGLGQTSAEVARTLGNSGVRGTPKDVHSCAIAVYLTAILGADTRIHSVKIDSTSARVFRGRLGIPMCIALPETVRTFIRAFDQGFYPDLIRDDRGKAPHPSPRTPLEPQCSIQASPQNG